MNEDTILEIANAAGKNPTQRNVAAKAIRDALTAMGDMTLTGSVPDETTPIASPVADVVIFVCSAHEMTAAETSTVWPRLDRALALYGRVEIVTFGARGAEAIAAKWARTRGQAHKEFALAWAVPNGDGTTSRDQRAVATRSHNVRAYIAQVKQPYALLFGEPSDRSYKPASTMFALVERHGANKATAQEPPKDQGQPQEAEAPVETNPVEDLPAVAA